DLVAQGVARVAPELILVGLAGSRGLAHLRERGLRVAAEGFADRAYQGDGALVPRSDPRALVTDPATAAAQAVRLARSGAVEPIAVPPAPRGAAAILAAVRRALVAAGFALEPLAVERGQP